MLKNVIIFVAFLCSITTTGTAYAYDPDPDSATLNPPEYHYIPGEADYDLIKDRLSCLKKTIPLHYTLKVHGFVNYFTVKNRKYTLKVLRKKEVYFPLFEEKLRKYKLPEELKYLAIVESGLNPVARSRAGAVGLWQFMSATGRYFGLHSNWYTDERMDPEKSTEAACKYLKQLYGMFGDWELAISAYNTGPGNIRKAIRRSGYKKTFREIYPYLHRETRSYLPQFIAMIYTVNYAHEHNFITEDTEYPVVSDTIAVDGFVHLKTLASELNLCEKEILELNPEIRYGLLPENVRNYPIHIPRQVKADFIARRTAILEKASQTGKKEMEHLARHTAGSTYGRHKTVYRVRRGDVLGTIAQKYRVRISDIRRWNNIRGNLIKTGQRLTIWTKSGFPSPASRPILASRTGTKTYIVQPGDTLWNISRKFEDLSIEKIKKLNALKSNKIVPGQRLVIGS